MSTDSSTLTLVSEIPLPLAKAKELDGLAVDSSAHLVSAFAPSFTSFYALVAEANAITDDEPTAAKAMRLKIVKVRTGADRVRIALKADSSRIIGAIDGLNKLLLNDLTPVEKRLEDIEKREVRLQAARINTLADTRRTELSTFTDPTNLVHYDLGNMPAPSYVSLLSGLKAAKEALAKADAERIEALKKAEADRALKEAADKLAREKLEADNARLAAEAKKAADEKKALLDKQAKEQAARDAQALKDKQAREAQEAKEKKARDEAAQKLADAQKVRDADIAAAQAKKDAAALKERQELEAKARDAQAALDAAKAAQLKKDADIAAAEAQKAADLKAATLKAARAPDKAKLLAFAAAIKAIPVPTLTVNLDLNASLATQHAKMVSWLEGLAAKL